MKDFFTAKKQNKFTIIILMIIMSIILFSQLMLSGRAVSAQMTNNAPDESVDSYSALFDAIGRAPSDGTLYIVEVTDNITMAGTPTVGAGKNIFIVSSDTSNPCTLTKSSSGRHFSVSRNSAGVAGTLILENIILDGTRTDGSSSGNYGGVSLGS